MKLTGSIQTIDGTGNNCLSVISCNKKNKSNDKHEKCKRYKLLAWNFFSEYCDASTIHGVRYLGEKKRPIFERIFWIIIFIASVYACISLSLEVWDKWENHPVIVSFDDKSTSIGEIPFPAITICPNIKNLRENFDFTLTYQKLKQNETISREELEMFESVEQACDTTKLGPFDYPKIRNRSMVQDLFKIRQPFKEIFNECQWKGKSFKCEKFWSIILTSTGICYTFNSIGAENILRKKSLHKSFLWPKPNKFMINWKLDEGYNVTIKPSFPRRIFAAGYEVGLNIILTSNMKDNDDLCGFYVPGFRLIIHTPNEIPQSNKNYIRVPFGQELLVAVKPNMRSTSRKLQNYSPERRQCYFQNERYLQYFQVYTQNNCELECLSNFTRNICNCIDFYLPRDADARVCRHWDEECRDNALLTMIKSELKDDGPCNCLPACTSIAYDSEVSQSEILTIPTDDDNKNDANINFDTENQTDIYNTSLTMSNIQEASVIIFFKEDQFWTSKRSELYGIIDFLANIGGVVGLFMGVSALSIIEIFYFITFRLFRYIKYEQTA